MRRRGNSRKGFAMLVIMLIIAVMAVGTLALLDRVKSELELVGQDRRISDARMNADGAVMELINDERTPDLFPDYSTVNLLSTFTPPQGSPYADDTMGMSYTASLRLLRYVPVSESSQNWARALVYEATATGTSDYGRATSEVRAQVFKTISVPPGTLLPRVHAR